MKIAYLTNCFGIQSHTFIRREIRELMQLGLDVELFGIRAEASDKLSQDEKALVERTTYLYPLKPLYILWLNLVWSVRSPRRYWRTLLIALTNNERKPARRIKLVYHFFVAVYLARAMKKSGVSHIHVHFMNVSASVGMYASLLTGIPYSVTVHSAGTRDAPHIIGIPMKLKYAQFLIMISQYNIEYFDAIYPCREKSTVVRCGMDLDQFPVRPAGAVPAPTEGAVLSVVAVGRFVEKKGFHYLLEALAQLQQGGEPVHLEILGSGPLENELKKQVRDLALQDSVHFFGPASTGEVREKMLASHVVVVPSVTGSSGEMEGIPVVLMEAMALGVPVVSTRHSGIPELVRDGETGLLVEERDAQALALALQRLRSCPAEAQQWTRNARALIESEFNILVVAQQRQELFSQTQ